MNKFKHLGIAFLTQVLLGFILIFFGEHILERTDIAVLMGIGSLLLSSFSFTIVTIYIGIKYIINTIKNRNEAKV